MKCSFVGIENNEEVRPSGVLHVKLLFLAISKVVPLNFFCEFCTFAFLHKAMNVIIQQN